MRAFAVIFLLLAVVLAVDAARDQYRGIAEASGPPMLISASSLSAARLWTTFSAVKATDSEACRGLMVISVDSCRTLRCRRRQLLAFRSAIAQA